MASRPAKKRRLSPEVSDAQVQRAFFKGALNWNLEEDYANSRAKKGKKKRKESTRLPIKTSDGRIEQLHAPEEEELLSIASDAEWLEADGNEALADVQDSPPRLPEQPKVSEREQIRIAQEELAQIAALLNEDPEDHAGAFKALAKVGESPVIAIQKLALVTQLAVYKDVIPGYRIQPATEDAAGDQLSKDVRKLRAYELALVSGYQAYLRTLASFTAPKAGEVSGHNKHSSDMANIAVTCACALLVAVPHFNFRTDLLKILVRKLSRRSVDESAVKCRQALETLFREDEGGRPSMEAVSMLTKMMKAREYKVAETVLNLFLHLRLLSEFSGTASADSVTRSDGDVLSKKKRKEREFRTKRERKQLKEQKSINKVMSQADALVSHEERDQMQSETLKMVFATYFRIAKLRPPHLMGAVLEGLAKYSHLINQDFFGDLLEALKDLIRKGDRDGQDVQTEDDHDVDVVRDTNREGLLCTVTAFALLAGQDAHNARSDLHLDLSFFTHNIFSSLLPLSLEPDLELGPKSLRLKDPDDPLASEARNNKVNFQTTTVLLLRCLQAILLPPWNIRSVPPLRLAAFTKQLMTAVLHLPEKSSQAVLALLSDVANTHSKKIGALWNTDERKGEGSFLPLSAVPENTNPLATTIFEGELLRRHYCPKVREGAKSLEKAMANSR